MQKNHNTGITAHGFALSGAAVMYLFVIYIGVMWGFLIALIPLVHFFPVLKEHDWLTILPSLLIVVILLLHILCSFYTVVLNANSVMIKWFGITVRKIPVARFKVFCAVGNEREDVLCLSCYSINEMANKQERRLLRSFLYKHDVPLRKRRTDWQDSFAREYLNHLRKSPFSIFRERDVIMIEMHPALQYAIRQMYPQLPYRNYTGVTSYHASRFGSFPDDRAVCFPSQLHEYEVHMEPDGIHIRTKKEEISFIPAQQIKTVVRVDIFKGYEKYYPHHIPLLYISSIPEEELALHTASKGYGIFRLNIPTGQSLMAMTAATYLALRWTKKKKDSCVVYHTEKNLAAIQSLYTHVQFNNIATCWLNNSDESLSPEA